jgi:hypothetical protein
MMTFDGLWFDTTNRRVGTQAAIHALLQLQAFKL